MDFLLLIYGTTVPTEMKRQRNRGVLGIERKLIDCVAINKFRLPCSDVLWSDTADRSFSKVGKNMKIKYIRISVYGTFLIS